MVLLAELNAFGARLADAQPCRAPPRPVSRKRPAAMAIWLIPGTMYERVGGEVYNTASVIDPAGERGVSAIARSFRSAPTSRTSPAARSCACSMCRSRPLRPRDLLRHVVSRARALAGAGGAEVILNPTLTNTIDRDVELSIARANAAVNQCYFVSVNAAGRLGFGESIICGPGGEVIYQAGKSREIIPVELDFEYLRRVRRTGWQGLGQPLKSLRDSQMDFTSYLSVAARRKAFRGLGALEVPGRRRASA